MINMHQMQPSTEYAWRRLRDHFFNNDGAWIQKEHAAWLFVLLREMPDTEDLFPHGKWASIQYFESLIAKEAQIAVGEYRSATQDEGGERDG